MINEKTNYALNGCCLLNGDKIDILEYSATKTNAYINSAKTNKSSFFQQVLLIRNSQIIDCVLWKDNKDYRRALVEIDNTFSVIESKIPMSIKEFQEQLIAINTVNV